MPNIDLPQLSTWASPPSSSETERIIRTRRMVEDKLRELLPVEDIKRKFNLSEFRYEVYLQGSYANSTNVRLSSDVDIVVQLNSVFGDNTSQLDTIQKALYDQAHSPSMLKFKEYKDAIYAALKSTFGERVEYGNKTVKIPATSSTVDADVIPCFQYRIYKKFLSHADQEFVEGMKFYDTTSSDLIVNFPKLHIKNCESKNVDTEGRFKDLIRIFKNMRNKLEEEGKLTEGTAPSYYIENLLYNCTSPCFDGNYADCMIKTLQFLSDAYQTGRAAGFVCANEQDNLFSDKTWSMEQFGTFLITIANYYLGE